MRTKALISNLTSPAWLPYSIRFNSTINNSSLLERKEKNEKLGIYAYFYGPTQNYLVSYAWTRTNEEML